MSSENQELKQKEQQKSSNVSGLVFVGCLMIGIAVGFIMGNVAVGVMGGLGVGFIGMALTMGFGKQIDRRKGISGLMFVGCLMIGFAFGLFTGNVVVGFFGGLGIGFITMAIAYQLTNEW